MFIGEQLAWIIENNIIASWLLDLEMYVGIPLLC